MKKNRIQIEKADCTHCGKCIKWCVRDAITVDEHPIIDQDQCIYCGECMRVCPENLIEIKEPRSNQKIYEDFAEVYSSSQYPKFSKAMADLLPDILDQFDVEGKRLLDIACGEGSFAVKMAEKRYEIVAVDISPQQIENAEEKNVNRKVDFVLQDMRDLSFDAQFDIATCWYDSLNYILDKDELKRVFQGVYTSLRKGGIFIFDVNTIYVMEEVWDEQTMVKEDSDERFDMIEQNYDGEKHITSMKLTSFLREKEDRWRKIEEIHRERAYSFKELRKTYRKIGFEELGCWKDLEKGTPANEKTERAWFVLQKKR